MDGNKINFFCIKNIDGTIDDKDATDGSGIGITAGNITINDDILNNVMLINAGVDRNSGSNDGNRALAIAQLRNMAFQVQNVDGNTTLELFKKGNGFGVNQDEVITFTNDPSG